MKPPLNFVASYDGDFCHFSGSVNWIRLGQLVMPVCTHTSGICAGLAGAAGARSGSSLLLPVSARQLDFFTWWIGAPGFPKGQVPLFKCLLRLCLRPTS